MSRLISGVLAMALALCLTAGEAAAWNRTTNRQILENAIWLMPQALKIILVEHRDEVYRGCFEAMEKLPEPEILWHTTSGDGVGPRELDRAVQKAVQLINNRPSSVISVSTTSTSAMSRGILNSDAITSS